MCPCALVSSSSYPESSIVGGVLFDSLSSCVFQVLTLVLSESSADPVLICSMQSNHLATESSRRTLPCAKLHVSRGCRAPVTSGNPLSAQSFRQQNQVLVNPKVYSLAAGVSTSKNAPVVRADKSASPSTS